VAASQGKAWAVGERLNSQYQDRALVEVWNGTKWSIAEIPQPGDVRDMLFAASALSPSDVWVVGDQESANGVFETLAEHWNGSTWTVVPTPDPGSSGNHLYAVDAVSPDDVWAAGQQLGAQFPDNGLVEHWDGHSWSVVPVPAATTAAVMLDGIAATADVPSRGGLGGSSPLADTVYVAGEADSASQGGRPLIETYQDGAWQTASLPAAAGSLWTNLWGITVAAGTAWAVGTYVDPKTDNNNTLILSGTNGTWTVDAGPEPGSGSNILGGVTTVNGHPWAAGIYDDGGSELPLIEHR